MFASAESASVGWSGVLFGPDRTGDLVRDLYVGNNETDEVLVFDGVNGEQWGVFVTAASGGIDGPHDMQFGPNGNLYVASSVNTTNFDQVEQIYRYDGTTGAFIDIPVAEGSGLGGATTFLTFNPQGELLVSGGGAGEVLRYSAGPLVSLSEASVNPITIDFNTTGQTASAGSDYAAVTGRLTFALGETSKRILVTAADDGVNESSETFAVNLSNPSGAIIGDSQAQIAILNSQTKFFVANDATTSASGKVFKDETYKYDSSGTLIVSSLWIVDSNSDRVYEYANARNKISGNQSANVTFVLAAGNDNPQGIAGPPLSNSVFSNALLAENVDTAGSVSATERGFMQAPSVSFAMISTERFTSLRSNVERIEGVDETMSQLISGLPIASTSVTRSPSMPLSSRPRIAVEQSIDLAFADD